MVLIYKIMTINKTYQYRSVLIDTMSSQFTKETQEKFPKRGCEKDGAGQSKIKRRAILARGGLLGRMHNLG